MPLDQTALDELKASIASARKRELAFGLCLGKSAETTILACHKTKDPETIGRQAKKDGETNKVAFGMMTVDGKNLNLSCQGDVPPGMARRTREMLKLAGFNFKVRLLDAQGNTLEEDGAEGDGAEGGAAADPLAEEWTATKARVAPRVETARALPPGEEILADWQAAVARADEGDLRAALMAVEAVERRIAEAEEAAKTADADRARWEDAAPKLAEMVEALKGASSPAVSKLAVMWSVVQGKVNGPVGQEGLSRKDPRHVARLPDLARRRRGAVRDLQGAQGPQRDRGFLSWDGEGPRPGQGRGRVGQALDRDGDP